jgi:tetratricopeptide (TPR) repeat protein
VSEVISLLAEASALHQAGRLAEAEKTYQQILAAEPDHFDSLHLLGIISHQRGDHAQALRHIDLALKVIPDNALALNNRGIALKELKRFEEALASYDRALALQPDYAAALLGRANTLTALQRLDEALAGYDRALAVRRDFTDAHVGRGNALYALQRFEEALADYDRAVALRPDHAEAYSSRGATLHELKRFEEALASYDRALALLPDYAEARYNRGNALHALNRFEEALADYDRALALRPDYAEALVNRGITLHQLKRIADALASYDRALALRPDYVAAHYNEGMSRMLIGDIHRGWQKLEWGWVAARQRYIKRDFPQPQWRGSNEIAGKTVLLHAEQGFGDMIQFCRYIPRVAELGARVIFEVYAPLRELMGTLPGVAQFISTGEPLPDFDMHCPMMSLALALGAGPAAMPAQTPYLRASPQAVTDWNGRLGPRHRPRIGLAWSGRPAHDNDHNRSMRLGAFLPGVAGFDATYVSLQREVREHDAALLQERGDVLHFGDELKTYADTAALIANLDLVIAVDTSVAHLAGALAKPVWILLPFIPDWRWLLDRDDSPWYPTARLFRQDETRGWDGVVARVHDALDEYLRRRESS